MTDLPPQYRNQWKDIQLASFAKQSSLQFTLSSSDISQVNQLSFSLDPAGPTYNFDLAFGDVFKELTGTPLSSHLLMALGKMHLKLQNILI